MEFEDMPTDQRSVRLTERSVHVHDWLVIFCQVSL